MNFPLTNWRKGSSKTLGLLSLTKRISCAKIVCFEDEDLDPGALGKPDFGHFRWMRMSFGSYDEMLL